MSVSGAYLLKLVKNELFSEPSSEFSKVRWKSICYRRRKHCRFFYNKCLKFKTLPEFANLTIGCSEEPGVTKYLAMERADSMVLLFFAPLEIVSNF